MKPSQWLTQNFNESQVDFHDILVIIPVPHNGICRRIMRNTPLQRFFSTRTDVQSPGNICLNRFAPYRQPKIQRKTSLGLIKDIGPGNLKGALYVAVAT